MESLADRFRLWFEYERNCNAKSLEMLSSVPVERRDSPEFRKAANRLGHILAARRLWLHRLGQLSEAPRLYPGETNLTELPTLITETETAWIAYLAQLDESELSRVVEVNRGDGKQYRWTVEQVLTQLFGHAWYHRGQIAQLVATLGGKPMDTDFIFWCGSPAYR